MWRSENNAEDIIYIICSAVQCIIYSIHPSSHLGASMFKKFTVEEHVSSTSQIKNSVQRGIQAQVIAQYPKLEPVIEDILPKKAMQVSKCLENIQLILIDGEVVFFNQRDGPFFPTLKLVHKFPTMMPAMQVDKGAIKFVLSGANIMCPGFTSPGGQLPIEVAAEQPGISYDFFPIIDFPTLQFKFFNLAFHGFSRLRCSRNLCRG